MPYRKAPKNRSYSRWIRSQWDHAKRVRRERTKQLKDERKRRKLTVKDVAKLTGLSPSTIGNGERMGYGKATYRTIWAALDMPKSSFIND